MRKKRWVCGFYFFLRWNFKNPTLLDYWKMKKAGASTIFARRAMKVTHTRRFLQNVTCRATSSAQTCHLMSRNKRQIEGASKESNSFPIIKQRQRECKAIATKRNVQTSSFVFLAPNSLTFPRLLTTNQKPTISSQYQKIMKIIFFRTIYLNLLFFFLSQKVLEISEFVFFVAPH